MRVEKLLLREAALPFQPSYGLLQRPFPLQPRCNLLATAQVETKVQPTLSHSTLRPCSIPLPLPSRLVGSLQPASMRQRQPCVLVLVLSWSFRHRQQRPFSPLCGKVTKVCMRLICMGCSAKVPTCVVQFKSESKFGRMRPVTAACGQRGNGVRPHQHLGTRE